MSTINSYKVKMKDRTFPVNIERYNSAQEVVQDCRTRSITNSKFHDMQNSSDIKDYEEWYGVSSYDEALELLKNGYQPTVEKLSAALKINKMGTGKRISFQNNVVGFAPVVPLALNRVPNCMMDMTMKPIKCKVVDVYYDIGVSCNVDTDTIIENGQKILGAIIEMEKKGYRFNLYSIQNYSDDSGSDMICVKVKSADKPIDIKRISFPLTHPAFFRVIGFDWYSKMPIAKHRWGYGHPLTRELNKTELAEFVKQTLGENAIYLSGTNLKDMGIEHLQEVLTDGK